VLTRVRERVLPSITREEPVQAWIIDDTGFPKKGSHSVGVARQYCGQLGKQDNCQVAVSLSVATHQGSLPVAYRLYLPKVWADDPVRRAIAGVPDDIRFQTKPEIALRQLRQAVADGVPPGVALMDPAYGNDSKLRAGISELSLAYVAGIQPTTMVWRPGEAPLPPAPRSGRGRRATRLRRDETHRPVSAKTLALELAADAWQRIKWRDGSNTPLTANISLESMVDQAKLRWRIERDYLELKQEVGLGHYEGRGWRGFHHHATLCVAAYGFLISEKETIPPSGPASARQRSQPTLPAGYRPRGSAATVTTPHAELNRHAAYPPRAHAGAGPATVPLLRPATDKKGRAERVTQ
jgi:SRSO17 transposase